MIRQSSGTPRPSRNKLWSSVMATAPSSTWQHENLEGVMKYGTVIRRQPTKTEFKSVKKMIFTSGKLMFSDTWKRPRHAFRNIFDCKNGNKWEWVKA